MANVTTSFSAIAAAAVIILTLSAGAAAAAAPAPAPIGKPGCETTCGKVSVPFPFGMGPARCYATGFNLTCDKTRPGPPRLLLSNDSSFEVQNISVKESSIRVARRPIFSRDARNVSNSSEHRRWGGLGDQYMLSSGNDLVLTGCNVQAMLYMNITSDRTAFVTACSTYCERPLSSEDLMSPLPWYGVPAGFCNTSINGFYLSSSYEVELKSIGVEDIALKADDPPVYVLIAESGWFNAKRAIDLTNLEKPVGATHARPKTDVPVPVILKWECPDDGSCNSSVSTHSRCAPGGGTQLWCDDGYAGNPYVTGGCQDVNECERPGDHGCFGDCTDMPGTFLCKCPKGFHGNHSIPNGCVKTVNTGLNIGIGVGIGAGVILLILTAILIIRKLELQRARKLRKKFFKQNRGQLLQQLVSQRADITERMIITLKELEKATNNFDKARELGGGGHGIVYKGILSDLHVVAIKKPKMMIQKEIDEFINEVAILSQINHRNVVKLYGCCLETEVPMLVYEFISNGTLCGHLHAEGPRSLSWGDRLRIAIETAKSLAYLHSATSIPIIHRDIKSANILLDDNLVAKVADFGASRYIPLEKSGVTTTVQGTIGYLDPTYFYTWRLTDKSDVFSFGVILIELLTRKKPFSYMSSQGDGLVAHFVSLFAEGNLSHILDPQVMEEGDKEVEEVATLAVACIKLKGEDRPTMRQVELTLESLQLPGQLSSVVAVQFEQDEFAINGASSREGRGSEESTRRYSMEEEFVLSASYPR